MSGVRAKILGLAFHFHECDHSRTSDVSRKTTDSSSCIYGINLLSGYILLVNNLLKQFIITFCSVKYHYSLIQITEQNQGLRTSFVNPRTGPIFWKVSLGQWLFSGMYFLIYFILKKEWRLWVTSFNIYFSSIFIKYNDNCILSCKIKY